MLAKGEPTFYLVERFPGLNDSMIRSHRDLHMDPHKSTEFASPQNRLWDLQEIRVRLNGIVDYALQNKTKPKTGIAMQAMTSLTFVLRDIGVVAEQVIRIQSGVDGELYKEVIREFLSDKPELMGQFIAVLQRKQLQIEEP